MPANQLIQLKPDQIKAIANHLEQAAIELRDALANSSLTSIWISDVQNIETMLGSTDALLREVHRSLKKCQSDEASAVGRVGRPRRTRRRKP